MNDNLQGGANYDPLLFYTIPSSPVSSPEKLIKTDLINLSSAPDYIQFSRSSDHPDTFHKRPAQHAEDDLINQRLNLIISNNDGIGGSGDIESKIDFTPKMYLPEDEGSRYSLPPTHSNIDIDSLNKT